jgi:hypothetical protein
MTATLENEASLENFGVVILMYFTYCQSWIILMFRALFQEIFQKGRVRWEKTPRFASAGQKTDKIKSSREKSTKGHK